MTQFPCVNSCSKDQGICNLTVQEKVWFVCDTINRKEKSIFLNAE